MKARTAIFLVGRSMVEHWQNASKPFKMTRATFKLDGKACKGYYRHVP